MGFKDWFMKRAVRKMSHTEKLTMMEKMMDEFFSSMTVEDRKAMMKEMMPRMMGKMFEGRAARMGKK